jgi:hypothetical protein
MDLFTRSVGRFKNSKSYKTRYFVQRVTRITRTTALEHTPSVASRASAVRCKRRSSFRYGRAPEMTPVS